MGSGDDGETELPSLDVHGLLHVLPGLPEVAAKKKALPCMRSCVEEKMTYKMTQDERRAMILVTVEDLVLDFLDGDEELTPEDIEAAIRVFEPSISEIVLTFEEKLRELLPVPVDTDGLVGQAAAAARDRVIGEESERLRKQASESPAGEIIL
jgi:hypothetical protein